MGLTDMVSARIFVDQLCAAIDDGRAVPDEKQLYALAERVVQIGGPLAHDLVCKIASRTKAGRAALKDNAH